MSVVRACVKVEHALSMAGYNVLVSRGTNWASEASPTLGCSIEISRDICIYSILHILTIVFPSTRTVEYQPIYSTA